MPVDDDNWNYFNYPVPNFSVADDSDENPPAYDDDSDSGPEYSALDSKDAVSPAYDTITIASADGNDLVVYQSQPQTLEVADPHNFVRATKLYGNPLAKDAEWSVTQDDFKLTRLPQIGAKLTMRNSFRTVKNPAKHARPGFKRDPHSNPWFDPEMEFEPVRIPNKMRKSRFVGTGFRRVFNGDIFARHDVSAADWQQFLYDITAAGSSAIGTIPLGRNIVKTGLPFSNAAGNLLQMLHEESARNVIDVWQKNFFAPRGLCVSVEKGDRLRHPTEGDRANPAERRLYKQQKLAQKMQNKDYGKVRLVVSKMEYA